MRETGGGACWYGGAGYENGQASGQAAIEVRRQKLVVVLGGTHARLTDQGGEGAIPCAVLGQKDETGRWCACVDRMTEGGVCR
jgi:hypothetical protein